MDKHPFTEEEILDLYSFANKISHKYKMDADEYASQAFAMILQECAAFKEQIRGDTFKYAKIEIARYLKRLKIQLGKDAGRTVAFQDYDVETTNQIVNQDIKNEYYKECDRYRFNQISKKCKYCHTKNPKFGSFCSLEHRKRFNRYLRYKFGLSDKKIRCAFHYKCTHCRKQIFWSTYRRRGTAERKFCNNKCKKSYYRSLQGICSQCQEKFIRRRRGQKFCSKECRKKYHKEISRKSRLTIFSDDSMI